MRRFLIIFIYNQSFLIVLIEFRFLKKNYNLCNSIKSDSNPYHDFEWKLMYRYFDKVFICCSVILPKRSRFGDYIDHLGQTIFRQKTWLNNKIYGCNIFWCNIIYFDYDSLLTLELESFCTVRVERNVLVFYSSNILIYLYFFFRDFIYWFSFLVET